MENGEKLKINLESELDVQSSDMLVSIDSPKFQHNRQKYQGGYMPSSLRFEHDGWAAGNDVYQFKINEQVIQSGSFSIVKYSINDNPSYELMFRNADSKELGRVVYNDKNTIKSHTCNSCEVSGGTNPDITGTINNKPFSLSFNSLTNEVTNNTDTAHNIELLVSDVLSDYTIDIKLRDNDNSVQFTFNGIRLPSESIYNDEVYLGSFLSFVDGVNTWQSNNGYSFLVDTNTNKLIVLDKSNNEIMSEQIQINNGVLNKTISVPISLIDNIQVTTKEIIPAFTNMYASAMTAVVTPMCNQELNINKQEIRSSDVPYTGMQASDTLYKNLTACSNKSDFNNRRVIQILPTWIGVHTNVTVIGTKGVNKITFDIIPSGPSNLFTSEHITESALIYDKQSWSKDVNVNGMVCRLTARNFIENLQGGSYKYSVYTTVAIVSLNYDEYTLGKNINYYTVKDATFEYRDAANDFEPEYEPDDPSDDPSTATYSDTYTLIDCKCIKGYVASNINIASNNILENLSIGIDTFAIQPITSNVLDGAFNLSKYLKHTITNATCNNGSLTIKLSAVSVDSIVPIFYCNQYATTEDDMLVCPGHIAYGDIEKITDNEYNISCYYVQKKYDAYSVDMEYGLTVNVTGTALQINEKAFTVIDSMESSISIGDSLPGSLFMQDEAGKFVDDISYKVNTLHGYFNVVNNIFESSADVAAYQMVDILIRNTIVARAQYNLDGSLLKLLGANDEDTSSSFDFNEYTIAPTTKSNVQTESDNILPVINSTILYTISDLYTFDITIPGSLDTNYVLDKVQNNIFSFTSADNNYKLDINNTTKQVSLYKKMINEDDETVYIQRSTEYEWNDLLVNISSEDIRNINAVLQGVYDINGVTIDNITGSNITYTLNGETNTFNASAFNNTENSYMEYFYTRVYEKQLKETLFAKTASSAEMQFLKQQWDTTNNTENFWWVDSTHVLVLTKYALQLKQKTQEVSDWDGDIFETIKEWPHTQYITNLVYKYFCTNAYNGEHSYFITIGSSSYKQLKIDIYDILDDMTQTTVYVDLNKVNIGSRLCVNTAALCTYSDIDIYTLITHAKWSSTCVDGKIIIGIHYDKNFNQWAVLINTNGMQFEKVIQGYGFVGVDGSLTGGQIPAQYFDTAYGFTDTVQPLSILKDTGVDITSVSQLYQVKDRIVGDDTRQWYISSKINGIVSHLTFINGSYTANILPITNNYAIQYDSGSYNSSVISDFKLNVKPLSSIFDGGVLSVVVNACLYPQLCYLNPKINVCNYLQQTIGQAAYVHYNDAEIYKRNEAVDKSDIRNYSKEEVEGELIDRFRTKPIDADELSFDRQSVKQTLSNVDPYTNSFTMCASALISALDTAQDMLAVNKQDNSSNIVGVSKSFTQNFVQNISSMTASDMSIKSLSPTQTSEVTALKTLDMFYSTSKNQNVCAGPGYVNHNFVAQCVVQSVTSIQSEYLQQRLLYIIGALAEYPIRMANYALAAVARGLHASMESISGSGFALIGVASGGTITSAISPVLAAGYAAAEVATNITKVGADLVSSLIDALGGSSLKSSITAHQSRHKYDIEPKHRYGSKHEHFMWPCFNVTNSSIVNEEVTVTSQNKSWKLSFDVGSPIDKVGSTFPNNVTYNVSNDITEKFKGDIPYYIAMTKGVHNNVTLPRDMACVIGTESFLPDIEFKNENISESEPVFTTPLIQDYIIDNNWQLGHTATDGMTLWISCKDTKIIDGEMSNCVISNSFCGVASPYTAIEVKRGIRKKYLRPWAITPQAIALNNTGLNCCFEEKAYHAFDGYGSRITKWVGSAGMNKERQTWLYTFLINDRFKRSNKIPQNEFLGNFKGEPLTAMRGDYNDKTYTIVTQPSHGRGLEAGTIGEDKDVRRYAVPVFSEFVNTLPASVKTLSAQILTVVDGVTSLTTENRDLQTAYKAPMSVDFVIGKNKYRYTQEYICSLEQISGVTKVTDIVPCLGLEYIGATPYEAYLYSQDTQRYYAFSGGSSLTAVDFIHRFRDVIYGRYDFINQEVVIPCLATFMQLDKHVYDDADETDNVIVPRIADRKVIGEVYPPVETIFNTRSGFKTISLPSGIVYQGPNRCIVNRFTLQDYMVDQIKDNYGKWTRIPREKYNPFRKYKAKYEIVDQYIGNDIDVKGWTHNPFLLVTSPLGVNNETDCLFEWEITFAWPVEMDKLYDIDNFAVVNIQAETMTPGGKVVPDRPVHVYLTKDLFTRTGNYGYYSFRYQSKCGAGNRERLHIWSDQYICISALQCEYKTMTAKRTEILTQQVDVQRLKEI